VKECDLMIVMGTALAVSPFNMLVLNTPKNCHQVLINRENTIESGFNFEKGNYRLFLKGNCDDVVAKLVEDLGWKSEFESI
jgi:NAD-dependent deacetylase sirtuin 2